MTRKTSRMRILHRDSGIHLDSAVRSVLGVWFRLLRSSVLLHQWGWLGNLEIRISRNQELFFRSYSRKSCPASSSAFWSKFDVKPDGQFSKEVSKNKNFGPLPFCPLMRDKLRYRLFRTVVKISTWFPDVVAIEILIFEK